MTRVERCRTYCCFLVLLVVSSAVCICGQAQDLAVSPASISAQKLLRWQHMTPAQQADLRLRYRAWLAMAPDEHVRILKAKSGIASLSPMQQQALQARFARLDRMYSRGWLLGPRLGAHYAHLQPLIGYVQESERTPLLALLHDLDDVQLAQLATLVQRTPPAQCDALRRELLAQTPAERDAWLRTRLRR
ncbi:DUF3106 domain-containing protein [Xylella fastidiosa subsp. sandyi]|uniref:DUF3106 domain-containing protein n=1 Tax=Xylella fastidiosa subsp. sandyi Ann-1 TaxID=155920 RepID=A0A060H0W0_XYLFS|nr:DUF3106 domain-containing protein [Xylella fastidiosa]AIC09158.1 hypothetical protein D934_00425 [Xylella fastidiosa subsp. sandyi Ann-1]MSS69518.1 DUF3106 domain-containing protein [Xylella fastidiosa subsp. multiplex]RWA44907.1 DUF3106 domain-containing protein [Xylella fastidiosa subsp. sandyi]KQH74756.1 hypothetical protein AOT81_00315 [Xylella fastidiosa]WNY19034.1 DUF3106 domain-containing protein [Xylella fastidiosa]